MAMSDRLEIVRVLREIGSLLAIKGENPYKIRAYEAAASRIEEVASDKLESLVRNDLSRRYGKAVKEVPDRTVAAFGLVESPVAAVPCWTTRHDHAGCLPWAGAAQCIVYLKVIGCSPRKMSARISLAPRIAW